ncbi:hypothetical protein WJX81_005352 [Elliptochloris bilobata]|uniref:Major facilitator superfamily (MFS) profile domain-containing protein n=1 Tax=Elliptochloris bilobata TaxID=381761 RepID=A0AAW1QNG8_9CHLO
MTVQPAGLNVDSAYSSPASGAKLLSGRASGGGGAAHARPQPWWYGPRRLLALFCYIMLLCYADIGLLASNGVTGTASVASGGQGAVTAAFGLTYLQLGLLPAMFMVGLMLACTVLSKLTAYFSPFRLVGVGMAMWVLGAVLTGACQNYGSLMFARIFMGAGEASLMTLSGPFVDDVAPPKQKAFWFSLLSLFPNLGVAAGYMYGNAVAAIGWRACFWIEAAFGFPVALLFLFAPAIDLRSEGDELPMQPGGERPGFWGRLRASAKLLWYEVRVLHRHPVFLANIWAYVPIQAVLGALTFWGPKAALAVQSEAGDAVDMMMGGMTLGAAVVGTLGGGLLLDRLGSSLRNAFLIQIVASVIALVASVCTFTLTYNLASFIPVFSAALIGLFVTSAPLYAVSMWAVPIPNRPAAQAMQVITMHALGDVPSPPVVGAIQSVVNNWRVSMTVMASMLGVSVVIYVVGLLYCRSAPDYREELLHKPLASASPEGLDSAHSFLYRDYGVAQAASKGGGKPAGLPYCFHHPKTSDRMVSSSLAATYGSIAAALLPQTLGGGAASYGVLGG